MTHSSVAGLTYLGMALT